jgi:hypothetical protein
VVVETVFSWPGLGRMLVNAVQGSDYPLAQGAFLIIAAVLVADELHRRPALWPARPAGVAWPRRLTAPLRPGRARKLPPVGARVLHRRRDHFALAGIADLPRVHARGAVRRPDRDPRPAGDPLPANGRRRTSRRLASSTCSAPPISGATSSRRCIGTRSALIVGLTAALIVVAIGTIVGLVSGYFGGWVDTVADALADIALGDPVPALRHRAGRVPSPSTTNVVIAVARCSGPTPRASSAARC